MARPEGSPQSEGEQLLDEMLHDPDGYRERVSAQYDAEAAEWVAREMARRLEMERQKSLTKRLLEYLRISRSAA